MNKYGIKNRILFVDDEPRITSALRATFRRDFNVVVANSGSEALRILEKHQIDVLVSDERMPGMLGHELLSKVSRMYPQTMRILLTGFTDKRAIIDSINDGEIFRFINKPWQNDEMRAILHEAAVASKVKIPTVESNDIQPIETNSVSEFAEPTSVAANSIKKTIAALPVGDRALLMVDQHESTRLHIRRFCNKNKIMIYGTKNTEQAVAAAVARKNIGVAILEFSSDNEAAIETINVLKDVRPDLVTLALTDEHDAETAVNLINQGQVFKYLAKPLDANQFEHSIRNAFIRHDFLKQNKIAYQRYSVEKPKKAISRGLRNLLKKLRLEIPPDPTNNHD